MGTVNASHVAGGGVGALLGALLSGVLSKYTSFHISDVDAAVIGSAAVAAGVGLAHGLSTYGLSGIGKRLWRGAPPPKVPSLPPPPGTQA